MPSLDHSVCMTCPLGTYSPTAGSSQCIPCSPGYYSNNVYFPSYLSSLLSYFILSSFCKTILQNQASPTSCQVCPPGTFSSMPGQSNCDICLPNTYSEKGSSSCSLCSSNMHSSAGSKSCTLGIYYCYYCTYLFTCHQILA